MSLFRRDAVHASVELDRVALVRIDRQGSIVEQCIVPLALPPDEDARPLARLAERLSGDAWRDTTRHVVLSDRLVRYLVVERPQGVRSLRELRAVVESKFESVFDVAASSWQIAVDTAPGGRQVVACGVQRRLLEAATAAFGADGACRSVQPYFVRELRQRSRRLPATCWFVVGARDCLAIAAIVDGECRRVGVHPVAGTQPAEIVERVAREALLHGDVPEGAPVLVSGVVGGDPATGGVARLDAVHWAAQPAGWSADFRVALAERWA